jgi:hypothetical protein
MQTIYTAPEKYDLSLNTCVSFFLAGTIDNGNSFDWQSKLISDLAQSRKDHVIFNPRRLDWNPDAGVDELKEQINWELDALEDSSIIVMYFADDSLSPISLLELGLFANTHDIIVYCSDKFWRKTNVDVVCHRMKIPVYETYEDFLDAIVCSF